MYQYAARAFILFCGLISIGYATIPFLDSTGTRFYPPFPLQKNLQPEIIEQALVLRDSPQPELQPIALQNWELNPLANLYVKFAQYPDSNDRWLSSIYLDTWKSNLPSWGDSLSGLSRNGGIYPAETYKLPEGMRFVGSWLGSDSAQGVYETPLFTAKEPIGFFVSGFPHTPGNLVRLEFISSAGESLQFEVRDSIGEKWRLYQFHLPQPEAEYEVKIQVVDGSQDFQGWLAISEPFSFEESVPITEFFAESENFSPEGYFDFGKLESPKGLNTMGSWMRSDTTQGRLLSQPFACTDGFYLYLNGYLNKPGNSLSIFLKEEDNARDTLPVLSRAYAESWELIYVPMPQIDRSYEVQIEAVDKSEAFQGWFAMTQPFQTLPYSFGRSVLGIALQIGAAVFCLSFLLIPGLLLRLIWQRFSGKLPLIYLFLPAWIILPGLGLANWYYVEYAYHVNLTAVFIIQIPALLLFKKLGEMISIFELKLIGLWLLVTLLGLAKASYAPGIQGELYGGSISRTLEVGDRSDSRISFHVAQVFHNGLSLEQDTALINPLFAPYGFTSRGPLSGLCSTVLLHISGVAPSPLKKHLFDTWTPVDPRGFALYRMMMMVLNASLIVLFGGALAFFRKEEPESMGMIASLLVATSPFFVHEVFFTWPKFQVVSFCLMALVALYDKRFVLAGVLTGISYLVHPLGLFSIPSFLLLLSLDRQGLLVEKAWPAQLRIQFGNIFSLCTFFLGIALVYGFWYTLNQGNLAQGSFLKYLWAVDGQTVQSLGAWLSGRLTSFLNTLVPFYLYLVNAGHPSVNVEGGTSPEFIRFFFQYWNTFPFGLGLVSWGLFLYGLYRLPRHLYLFFLIMSGVPLAAFTVYWGGATTGMMREGLHIWYIFTCLAFFIGFSFKNISFGWPLKIWLGLRLLELFWFMLLPPVWSHGGWYTHLFKYNDILCLILLCLIPLILLAWSLVELEHINSLRAASEKKREGRQ